MATGASRRRSLARPWELLQALWRFDPGAYLDRHRDLRAMGVNPWYHFLRHGLWEGRAGHTVRPLLRRDQAAALAGLDAPVLVVVGDARARAEGAAIEAALAAPAGRPDVVVLQLRGPTEPGPGPASVGLRLGPVPEPDLAHDLARHVQELVAPGRPAFALVVGQDATAILEGLAVAHVPAVLWLPDPGDDELDLGLEARLWAGTTRRGPIEVPGLRAAVASATEQSAREQADQEALEEAGILVADLSDVPGADPSTRSRRFVRAWAGGVLPRKPFPGFHPGVYREGAETGASGGDPTLAFLRAGRPEGPWTTPVLPRGRPSAGPAATPVEGRVAVHVHAFFPDGLEELLGRIAANAARPDVFVSVGDPADLAGAEGAVRRSGLPLGRVAATPNRGRNFGPLLAEFGGELLAGYEVVGHLHLKRSGHVGAQAVLQWTRFLAAHLVGDADQPMLDRILGHLAAHPEVGLVYPDDPNALGWGENLAAGRDLATRLGLSAPRGDAVDFPVGAMFLARTAALRPLLEAGLDWDDFPAEPLGTDGTMLHALERLLPALAAHVGLASCVTHVPGVRR